MRAVDTAGDLLLFEAEAQVCMTPDGVGTVRFVGCFRLWRQPGGVIRGCLYCDPQRYPVLAPDGLFLTLQANGPLEILEGHSFRYSDMFHSEVFLRFPKEGDTQLLARLWAENL